MFPNLSSISRRRKALNLTQKQLADAAGISQSLMTKIERGIVVPGYDIAVEIFNHLDEMSHSEDKVATEVMHEKVIAVDVNYSVSRVIGAAKRHAISQFPVLRDHMIVGSISTNDLIDKPKTLRVKYLAGDPFPSVSENTPVSTVKALLKNSSAVIVVKKDAIVGIITPENLL